MIQTSWFEHDGFRFTVKAQPLWGTRPAPDATPAQRQAFDLLASTGMTPEANLSAGVERYVRAWRVSTRAETTRRWSDVDTERWPSETHVSLTGDEATLVCHAALEVPAGTDLLQAVAERLRLEGPVGEEAAAAFVAGSLEPEQVGAAWPATLALGGLAAALITAAGLTGHLAAWARLAAVCGLVAALGALAWLSAHIEKSRPSDDDLERWRQRPFRGG